MRPTAPIASGRCAGSQLGYTIPHERSHVVKLVVEFLPAPFQAGRSRRVAQSRAGEPTSRGNNPILY